MKERNSELLFEAANRLAQRRGGDAEMGRRTYEAPALDDGRKALRDSKVRLRIV